MGEDVWAAVVQPLVFAKLFLSSRLSHFGHHSIPVAPPLFIYIFSTSESFYLLPFIANLKPTMNMCARVSAVYVCPFSDFIYKSQTCDNIPFSNQTKVVFFFLSRYIFLNNSFLQEHFRSFLREVFFFSPHIVFKVCVCVCASAHVKSRTSWKYCFSCKHAHRFLFSFLKKRKGKIVWSQSSCISIYCDHKTIFSLFTLTLVTRFQVSFLFFSFFLLVSTWFVHLFLAFYFVFIISTNQIR